MLSFGIPIFNSVFILFRRFYLINRKRKIVSMDLVIIGNIEIRNYVVHQGKDVINLSKENLSSQNRKMVNRSLTLAVGTRRY